MMTDKGWVNLYSEELARDLCMQHLGKNRDGHDLGYVPWFMSHGNCEARQDHFNDKLDEYEGLAIQTLKALS